MYHQSTASPMKKPPILEEEGLVNNQERIADEDGDLLPAQRP